MWRGWTTANWRTDDNISIADVKPDLDRKNEITVKTVRVRDNTDSCSSVILAFQPGKLVSFKAALLEFIDNLINVPVAMIIIYNSAPVHRGNGFNFHFSGNTGYRIASEGIAVPVRHFVTKKGQHNTFLKTRKFSILVNFPIYRESNPKHLAYCSDNPNNWAESPNSLHCTLTSLPPELRTICHELRTICHELRTICHELRTICHELGVDPDCTACFDRSATPTSRGHMSRYTAPIEYESFEYTFNTMTDSDKVPPLAEAGNTPNPESEMCQTNTHTGDTGNLTPRRTVPGTANLNVDVALLVLQRLTEMDEMLDKQQQQTESLQLTLTQQLDEHMNLVEDKLDQVAATAGELQITMDTPRNERSSSTELLPRQSSISDEEFIATLLQQLPFRHQTPWKGRRDKDLATFTRGSAGIWRNRPPAANANKQGKRASSQAGCNTTKATKIENSEDRLGTMETIGGFVSHKDYEGASSTQEKITDGVDNAVTHGGLQTNRACPQETATTITEIALQCFFEIGKGIGRLHLRNERSCSDMYETVFWRAKLRNNFIMTTESKSSQFQRVVLCRLWGGGGDKCACFVALRNFVVVPVVECMCNFAEISASDLPGVLNEAAETDTSDSENVCHNACNPTFASLTDIDPRDIICWKTVPVHEGMEQRRNERAREKGELQENPPTSNSIQRDSYTRKSGSYQADDRTRFAKVGGEQQPTLCGQETGPGMVTVSLNQNCSTGDPVGIGSPRDISFLVSVHPNTAQSTSFVYNSACSNASNLTNRN
ncbi:hypothetical protein PR048_021405 [Dryococelus australis]|uniref:Uncharacterized protein n=1 Tax=Dryococelus australis TaxID=614101 RepID=A0ABQ9GY64_9NEOP|nr:hypothetical protein PR048_021405 [Dryococelus australis]